MNLQIDQPTIRPMVVDDIPNVYLIERHAHAFPWSEGILRDCLRVNYQCLVVEANVKGCDGACKTILGFSVAQVAVQECHIMNICIDPAYQHKGLGGLLLQTLLSDANKKGAERAYLEVRESNEAARELYRKFGFDTVGRRNRYYRNKDGREDAIILALNL